MGYDFSQGYTSLERNEPSRPERRPGLLQRWKEKRRMEKQRRDRQEQEHVAQQLDAILEKVHARGIESLSEAERRVLDSASSRLRDQGKQNE